MKSKDKRFRWSALRVSVATDQIVEMSPRVDRCLLARGLSGFVLRMTKTCVRGRWRQTNTDIDKKMTDGKRERDTDRLAKRQRDEVTYASGLRVLKIHVVQQEKTKQNKKRRGKIL